jgi:hypothetical protein
VEGGVEDTVKWEERRLAEVLQEPQNAAFAIKAFGTRPRPPMDIGREAWMLAAFVRPADKMSSSTLSTLSSKEWRRERKGSEGGVVRQRLPGLTATVLERRRSATCESLREERSSVPRRCPSKALVTCSWTNTSDPTGDPRQLMPSWTVVISGIDSKEMDVPGKKRHLPLLTLSPILRKCASREGRACRRSSGGPTTCVSSAMLGKRS